MVVFERASLNVRAAMQQFRVPYGKTQHVYDLPPIAWCQLLGDLMAEAYGPRGGQKKGAPYSLYVAIGRIQEAVSRRENHPALKSRGIVGTSDEYIPAWTGAAGLVPYPDYGIDLDQSVVLVPWTRSLNGATITEWVPHMEDDLSYEIPWGSRPSSSLDFL